MSPANAIDPNQIPEEMFPLIVFAANSWSPISFLINWRTRGNYNHVMWMRRPGFFVSQNTFYSEIPIKKYMGAGDRLKFVRILGLTEDGRKAIINQIDDELKKPAIKRFYDYVGIIGQATGLKFINIPFLGYCSERVPASLKMAMTRCPEGFPPPLNGIIKNVPYKTSPQQFNEYLHDFHATNFPVYGKWEHDDVED